jgi:hypothetical protein
VLSELPAITDTDWDSLLDRAAWAAPYQRSVWARYDRSHRVACHRFVHGASTDCFLAQIFERRRLGVRFFSVPGGPVVVEGRPGSVDRVQAWRALLCHLPRRSYLRVAETTTFAAAAHIDMLQAGLRPALGARSSGLTMLVRLEPGFERAYSRNWRRYVKRAQDDGLVATAARDAQALADLQSTYGSTVDAKNMARVFADDMLAALVQAPATEHAEFAVFVARKDGMAHSARVVYRHRQHAMDLVAGTAPIGRDSYASYHVVDYAMHWLQEHGVKTFDFGGIDPVGLESVYNFKKGVGGEPVRYLGEWEHASHRLLVWLVAAAMRRRGGR